MTFSKPLWIVAILAFLITGSLKAQNDISLQQTASAATSTKGSNVTFTVVVTNQGATNLTGVQVSLPIPTGTTYVSDDATTSSTTYGAGVWNIGNIAAATTTVTLNLVVKLDAATEGVVTSTAQVNAMNETDIDSLPQHNTS